MIEGVVAALFGSVIVGDNVGVVMMLLQCYCGVGVGVIVGGVMVLMWVLMCVVLL